MSFKIIDLDESFTQNVMDIASKQLGAGYITPELMATPDTFTRVALFKNVVLGFSICSILAPDQIEKIIRVAANSKPKSLFGLLKTIAVRKDSCGFGIGGELAKDGVALLKGQVEKIYAVGWQSKKGVNANSILAKAGFKRKYKISDYWKEESLERNFTCHDCGNPPCRCSAVIFENKLRGLQ